MEQRAGFTAVSSRRSSPWVRMAHCRLADSDLAVNGMRPTAREETLALPTTAGSADMVVEEQGAEDHATGGGPSKIAAQ